MATISPEQVRQYIKDDPATNYLITGEEFDDARIQLAKEISIDYFNVMTPISQYDENTFPSRAILLYGILFNLYNGQAGQLARNHMTYTDAGLQIPIEERFELYRALAQQYGALFNEIGKQWKIQTNIEGGWGMVRSDYATFPLW